MCGIAGIWGEKSRDPAVIEVMTAALAHRGPDDEGKWIDWEAGVALGHRRLAIVDLTGAGHQPMQSADGRFVITFNGEIYNFDALRKELERQGAGPRPGWRGHCDVEVLLQAIVRWGLEATLAKLLGMFAFALWDTQERRLTLVRDRFGEKPLYFGWIGKDFMFASELKALRAHPQFDCSICRDAVAEFASRAYVPAPRSIYRRIFKLPPGCLLELTAEGAATPLDDPPQAGSSWRGVRLSRYWSYRDIVRRGLQDPVGDQLEAMDELEQALAQSVRLQSFADVPIGAFLSGGVDSSMIVALYQSFSATPVRTYSIGFEEAAYDEADQARAVAAQLGTIHQEQYITAADARGAIALMPSIYDEPFADPSQIPTYLVSKFAAEQVKVALTGDGGDELFAGYYRHFIAPRVWQKLGALPGPLRTVASSGLSRVPPGFWNKAAGILARRRQSHIGTKIQTALRVSVTARSFDDVYRSLIEEWAVGAPAIRGYPGHGRPLDVDEAIDAPDAVRAMFRDAVGYLPDDILCKVDRASMAASLETRAPFLDHRVAEVAARIPLPMKVRGNRGKFVLRQLLRKYLPASLVERPKNGFAVPVGEWIKGPLRAWADDLLDPALIRDDGWFDPHIVTACWRSHVDGERDSTGALWAVLMFQSWLREQRTSARTCVRPNVRAL